MCNTLQPYSFKAKLVANLTDEVHTGLAISKLKLLLTK